MGDAGHKGDLENPCPWRGQCRAGFSITGGPPKPRSEGAASKKGVLCANVHEITRYRACVNTHLKQMLVVE